MLIMLEFMSLFHHLLNDEEAQWLKKYTRAI